MKVPPARIFFSEEDRRAILDMVDKTLVSGRLTLGPCGEQFEQMVAADVGRRYAIAVNSGTSAIEIPLRILGVRDREVVVPTNTFFATVLAVLHAGGIVRFVDCDPESFSIDVDALEAVITDRTAGVIVVHIGGIVTPRMPEIVKICRERDLFLFEDAAHAHGSSANGGKAGTFGVAASFSFYPTKVVTSGEGGMIVTDDSDVDAQARMYRDQGKAGFTVNIHDKLGYNWRMSEVHAAIGLTHYAHLQEFIRERAELARIYDEELERVEGIRPLRILPGCLTNYYKYIATVDGEIDRTELKQRLRSEYDVGLSGEVYERPCHLQPYFAGQDLEGRFPKAEAVCASHICLPLFQGMTQEEARYVVSSLKDVYRQL